MTTIDWHLVGLRVVATAAQSALGVLIAPAVTGVPLTEALKVGVLIPVATLLHRVISEWAAQLGNTNLDGPLTVDE